MIDNGNFDGIALVGGKQRLERCDDVCLGGVLEGDRDLQGE